MSKALRISCVVIAVVAIPVYVLDAKLRGRWDSDGVMLVAALLALVVFEPPVAFLVREYFARKKAREEREKQERLLAERKARMAEALRIRLEREAAAEKAERDAEKRKAAKIWEERIQETDGG